MDIIKIKEIFAKIDKAEQESRFFNIDGDGKLLKAYSEAIGQMGIVHQLILDVYDMLKEEIDKQKP